jgi:anti-anti-sigma factor
VLFAVDRACTEGRAVLRVRGELDLATAPVLAASVDAELATAPSGLVLDLTATSFLDSSGCRELARSAKRALRAGAAVVVVCPRGNAPVRTVLDLLDLRALVPVVETAP